MNPSLIRVNVSDGSIKIEKGKSDYRLFGGRSLTSNVVAREVPPLCHPLGAGNKLIIAPGLLSGTTCVNTSRLSIGAKSPLTYGIKESNVGGTAAHRLGRLNVAGIVFEGKPSNDEWHYLLVNREGAELLPADDIKGRGNYETVRYLREKHGKKTGVICIGPAGEMRLSAASVAVADPDGHASRQAGRGGMGAVMGAKGIKAVVVDDTDAPGVTYHDNGAFEQAAKTFQNAVVACEGTRPKTGTNAMYGTAGFVNFMNETGGWPTRNYSQGQFEGVHKIDGDLVYQRIKERNGIHNHAGCAKCIIQCSNVYHDQDKKFLTSALEYETIWSLGANCGIDDLDAIASMDRLCDDYGLDTMETGCAIAVAMEAKVKSFGDAQGAIELINEIGKGTPLGRVLGNGATITGRILAVERVPQVKGQSMAAYDPRVLKGLGVTYATSPMGADHTAGFAAFLGDDDMDPTGKVQASLETQVFMAFVDATGICLMATEGLTEENGGIDAIVQMVNARFSCDIDMETYGREVLAVEREFNQKAGFAPQHDRLPEFFYKEPLPPHQAVFDMPDDDIDGMSVVSG